ncbi:TRAP transporter substrate-binding protein [Vibrio sp.]|uniref:TRAP transporter substrate-binding protein n=1 Tax=Vibrio sp. TaxID=678 RepID=UPI003D0AF80B
MKSKLIASLIALCSCVSTAAWAETTILRMSNWLPPTHPLSEKILKPWIAEVAKESEGRIKIVLLPKVVGSAATQFDVARDGIADITFPIHAYTPGRFPLQEISELPFLGDNAVAVGKAYWRIYNKHLAQYNEHRGVKLLGLSTLAGGRLHTTKKEINSIHDFSGLKVRVAGGASIAATSPLGAIPVQKPVSELYETLATGIVDGAMLAQESVKSFRLLDLINHTLAVRGGFYNSSYALVMNPEKFDSLSEQDQQALIRASGETWATIWGNAVHELDQASFEAGQEKGHTFKMAEGKLESDIKNTLSQVDAKWIARAEKAGLSNAKQVLGEFRDEIAKLEQEL